MNKNFLLAIITVLIWSSIAPLVKLMLADLPNLEVLSISSFLATAFLIVLNIKTGNIKEMKNYNAKDYGIIFGLGFLGFFLYNALYYYGIGKLTSQIACILNYLWPMMIVVFSCVLLGEKMTFIKAFSVLCSFGGIVLLSVGGGVDGASNSVTGMVACIAAAVFYGLFSVLNKKVNYNQYISMMIFWFVCAFFSMLLGLATETWIPITAIGWLGIAWIGIVVNATAYLLWALALNKAENTAAIANLAYLTPFLSLILSAVILGEKITINAVFALLLIVGGILVQSIYESRKSKEPVS